ncbi:MAG: response regulator [Alphaproteobacteria bacterium]|nr:response regulator [Alphaproteobacteria bacterium]
MAAVSAAKAPQGEFANVTALVVEDNDFVRDLVANQLKQIGFGNVATAPDGEAALKIVDEAAPGLMICDINMEPMGGFELITRLRDRGKTGGEKIPTIMLSSHAQPEFIDRARQLEVDAFLVKPVKKDALAERIRTVLQRKPS